MSQKLQYSKLIEYKNLWAKANEVILAEKKTLNKPFRTPSGPKKFSVYVKNEKGNVVKVNFGDPNMEIKRDDPNRRKNFRARHNCDSPGPKWKARYWSCKFWSNPSVTSLLKASDIVEEWDGCSFFDENELLALNPNLSKAEVLNEDCEFCFADCQGDGEELETEAKRSGPKSSAQTPAKPEEKRSGSSKNSPGSAETSSEKSIQFSKKIIEALKSKVKEHNSKYSKKVTLNQLKKVFRRGAGAFSSSHRPGKTRVQWAMARVNMFLKMVSGKPVKQAYKAADKDIAKASSFLYVDINPDDESFDLADKDITNADLIGYNDFTEEDLYFNDDYDESAFSKRINLLI